MVGLSIILDLEKDKAPAEYRDKLEQGGTIRVIGGLPDGTVGGKPTIGMIVEMPEESRFVYVETTLALFLTAADALRARYGDPRADSPIEQA